MDRFGSPEAWISLLTLTLMEVVLGIDNIIFMTILVSRLPAKQQARARRIGLSLALLMRLGLLFTLSWIMGLKEPFFSVLGRGISGRDMILLGGGLFLVGKATHEMYERLEVEGEDEDEDETVSPGPSRGKGAQRFAWILAQIVVLDIVFSLDSVITAVGMAQDVAIMVAAMVIAVGLMLVFARRIGEFINAHPSMKILALSFLLLIGVLLMADGMGQHVSKGYIYFALGFSLFVEMLNMRMRKTRQAPVHLHARLGERASHPPSS
ncbi:MAG: TerC family protein [Deltaproteobacteria bacterium]|nr:TerC family protein [Deltaproteobacteria bacterium]